jgi:hypothetical protein
MELRSNLRELRAALAALAARDASEGPSRDAAVGLDGVIETLQEVLSDLQVVRQGKRAVRS